MGVIGLVAYAFPVATAALERAAQTCPAEADLVPLSSHGLLRLLPAMILPPPRRDPEHPLSWSTWRRRHQHSRLCHQRWHAYASPGHQQASMLGESRCARSIPSLFPAGFSSRPPPRAAIAGSLRLRSVRDYGKLAVPEISAASADDHEPQQ